MAARSDHLGRDRPKLLLGRRRRQRRQTARCTRFANQLRGRFGLAVDYAEERLSSVEAEERLRDCGHNAQGAREHIDALAAQIILQCYFERSSQNSTDHQSHAAH